MELLESMLLRLGVASMLFRLGRSSTLCLFGELFFASRELLRRFSWVSTRGRRSMLWTWSIAEELGREQETLSTPALRPPAPRVVGSCCGLPPLPLRLGGMDTGDALMGVVSPRAGVATLELVRRDREGGCDEGRFPRMLPVLNGSTLELLCPVIDSKIALISEGMGTRCTRLTVGQSAACTSLFSEGLGGLQQPGHPGFW